MDDPCEEQLARAFAPVMRLSIGESCPWGEPYWAAKYFPETLQHPLWVRIAYMPAYNDDCGTAPHKGDSEFIMIQVQYNAATQHWVIYQAYLSAHAGQFTNSSDWPYASDLEYPSGRYASYPRVWVALNKHANYKSAGACNAGAFTFDNCASNFNDNGRIRVYGTRNVGSRHTNRFPDGAAGTSTRSEAGTVEYFYGNVEFTGWHYLKDSSAAAYSGYLNSAIFECLSYPVLGVSPCEYGP